MQRLAEKHPEFGGMPGAITIVSCTDCGMTMHAASENCMVGTDDYLYCRSCLTLRERDAATAKQDADERVACPNCGWRREDGHAPECALRPDSHGEDHEPEEEEEEEDDRDYICNVCRGSGEGPADGTRCYSCGGSGTFNPRAIEYEREVEEMRAEMRADEAREWGRD